jgi:hypothetical protein
MADKTISIDILGKDLASGPLKMISASLDHVHAVAKNAMQGMASAATAPTRALGALGSELGKIGQIAAGVALGGVMNQLGMGLSERLSGSIDAVRDLGAATVTLQRQIGGSTEEASGLLAVFGRYGMSQEDASRSLGTFSKHLLGLEDMEEAAIIGGKGFAGTMKDLGVNFLDVAGNALPMDDLLGKVADRFQAMPDGVDKTATAMTLFGKSGKDMLPILNLGRQGMQDAMDTAKKYGLVLSQDNVNDIKKFGAAQKDMNQAFSGLMIQVGTMVMPTLAKLATSVAGLVQQFSLRLLPAIRDAAAFLGQTLGPAFSAAGDLIGKFVDYFGASNTFDLMGKLFGPDIGPKIDQVVRKFESVGTAIMGIVTGSTGLGTLGIILGDALGSMGELGGSIWAQVQPGLIALGQNVSNWIATSWPAWSAQLQAALGQMGSLISTFVDNSVADFGKTDFGVALFTSLQRIADALKPTFDRVAEGIKAVQDAFTKAMPAYSDLNASHTNLSGAADILWRAFDVVAGTINLVTAAMEIQIQMQVRLIEGLVNLTTTLNNWSGGAFLDWVGRAAEATVRWGSALGIALQVLERLQHTSAQGYSTPLDTAPRSPGTQGPSSTPGIGDFRAAPTNITINVNGMTARVQGTHAEARRIERMLRSLNNYNAEGTYA